MKKAIKFFMKSNFTSLRSVHEMKETAYKTFEIRKGKLKPLKNIKNTNLQSVLFNEL